MVSVYLKFFMLLGFGGNGSDHIERCGRDDQRLLGDPAAPAPATGEFHPDHQRPVLVDRLDGAAPDGGRMFARWLSDGEVWPQSDAPSLERFLRRRILRVINGVVVRYDTGGKIYYRV